MGCVYSNDNDSSKKKSSACRANGDLTTATSNGHTSSDAVRWNGDNGVNLNGTNQTNDSNNNQRCRIFDVEVCNNDKDGSSVIQGKIEITDTSLIYRLKGRSPIIWPLRFLRSYGHDKDIFSFECGRRCPTGAGVYVFKCSNAEQLFKMLLEVINNNATNINSSNSAINNPQLSGTLPHSNALGSDPHEYENMVTIPRFESDHSNFATLPPRIPVQTEVINRPHSSMSAEPANHSYLNSAGNHVIGSKSQPNYYISSPISGQSTQLDGSKTSLNGTANGKSSSLSGSYDSSTLPASSRSTKYTHHEYVNSTVYTNATMDDSFMSRRKNSEQHLYENHEIPRTNASRPRKLEQINSKMTASDDLSTFCYVNLDLESRKERQAYVQGIFLQGCKSARTTPEPLSYIQLDLKHSATLKEANIQVKMPEAVKKEIKPEPVKDKSALKNETIKVQKSDANSNNNNQENKENTNGPQQDAAKADTDKASSNSIANTVPYAQIDFAKTLALSNSAANHRKL